MQKFLATPKYNKNYIYKNPTTLHQKFTNAFTYYYMIKIGNPICKKSDVCTEAVKEWNNIKKNPKKKLQM